MIDHELERQVLLEIPPVLGIDLSITNEVVLLWFSAAVTFVLVTLACRRRGIVARGFLANAFETIVEFVDNEVMKGSIGKAGRNWAPFLLSLFFFILFTNLTGMLPLPSHVKAMTSDLSVTLALAMVVFVTTIVVNIRLHGFGGFVHKFIPSGLPRGVALALMPIEIVSWLAKPASLAIRLFANMMAGHALIVVFIVLAMEAAWFLSLLPLAGAVIMSAFELFVCFIQAFVFTLLTGMYIKDAIEVHH